MKIGSIYIIKNTVNDKVYIGQTTMTVRERFIAHMKPSTAKLKRNYKLYNAVLKYGRDKFYVETLEDNVPLSILNETEIRYIAKYNSYFDGYNSSKGGDGRIINIIDNEEELLQLAKQGINSKEIAKKFNCDYITVLRTLHKLGFKYNVEIPKETLSIFIIEGKSNQEIANYFGVDKMTITRYLNKYNLNKYNKKLSYRDNFDLQELINDYYNQMSIPDICKKHTISQTTFYRIKNNNNLINRPQIYKNKTRYYD